MTLLLGAHQLGVPEFLRVQGSGEERTAALRERALAQMEQAKEEGVRILVLPELAMLPYPLHRNPEEFRKFARPLSENEDLKRIQAFSSRSGVVVCAGVFERDGSDYFSTAVLVDGTGRLRARVRKCPIGKSIGHFEAAVFSEGMTPGFEVLDLGKPFGKIGVTLSRGGAFFKAAEGCARLGAGLILNPRAQLAGLSETVMENDLRLHARDFAYHLVLANRVGSETTTDTPGLEWSGASLILSRDGEALGRASSHHEETIQASVRFDWTDEELVRPGLLGGALSSEMEAKHAPLNQTQH